MRIKVTSDDQYAIDNVRDSIKTTTDQYDQVVTQIQPWYKNDKAVLYLGDAKDVMAKMADNSVDCIMTSPPYYGHRDYNVDGQIGLEIKPQEYIEKLINVFQEARRLLKPTGSLWVNIGDTYWSGKGKSTGIDKKRNFPKFLRPQDVVGEKPLCVPKQLLLIPHRFAIAMQDDGWIVRNDNVWYKTAPIPDPVKDRCSSSHEYIFHFVKQRRYFYRSDAVTVQSTHKNSSKPPASVWMIKTNSTPKMHNAPFPEELALLPIRATCPQHGIFLDPFCGSGTALGVALSEIKECQVMGIDLSPSALEEAQQHLISKTHGNISTSRDTRWMGNG